VNVESVSWSTFPVLFALFIHIIRHTMFAYVNNIWCYSAPCGSCFWQTSQISPYPWQLILRVQTVGTVFKWICVMLSLTSLIVSSTFMAYTHTHTHTHKWLILSPSVPPLKTEAEAKQQEMDFDSSCEVNNIKVKCIRVIVIVMFKDKIILFQFYRENTMNCNRVFFSQPFSVFFSLILFLILLFLWSNFVIYFVFLGQGISRCQ